jgi:hypothetical protein
MMKKRYFLNLVVSALLFTTNPLFAMEEEKIVPNMIRVQVCVDETAHELFYNGAIRISFSSIKYAHSATNVLYYFVGKNVSLTKYTYPSQYVGSSLIHVITPRFAEKQNGLKISTRGIRLPIPDKQQEHILDVGKSYTVKISEQDARLDVSVMEDLDDV